MNSMEDQHMAGLEGDSGDEADLGAPAPASEHADASASNGLAGPAAVQATAQPVRAAEEQQQPSAYPTFKDMGLDSDSDDYDFDPASVQEASQPAAVAAAVRDDTAATQQHREPTVASQQLQAAGLEDSDEEADLGAGAHAPAAQRDPSEDEFADGTEDLGKAAAEAPRRPVGADEVRTVHGTHVASRTIHAVCSAAMAGNCRQA